MRHRNGEHFGAQAEIDRMRARERQNPARTVVHVDVPPPDPDEFKVKGTCQKCGQRPATDWWVGEGGALAWTHGMRAAWCKLCVVTEQLRYCREQAARVPELEAELLRVTAEALEP